MKKEFLSTLLVLASVFFSCDDGKIYDGDVPVTAEGSTLKITARIKGIDTWPDGYSVVVAGFGDNDYASISKGIPVPAVAGNPIEVVLSGISGEVSQIELCIINRLRKRIATFYTVDFDAQPDTLILDAGTIDAGMFTCIQENIFDKRCTTCHGASNTAAAGLNLTPGDSYRALAGVPALKSPDHLLLVDPGNVEKSFLHLVLKTDISASPDWYMDHIDMITSTELLNLIDDWIENGAKE